MAIVVTGTDFSFNYPSLECALNPRREPITTSYQARIARPGKLAHVWASFILPHTRLEEVEMTFIFKYNNISLHP